MFRRRRVIKPTACLRLAVLVAAVVFVVVPHDRVDLEEGGDSRSVLVNRLQDSPWKEALVMEDSDGETESFAEPNSARGEAPLAPSNPPVGSTRRGGGEMGTEGKEGEVSTPPSPPPLLPPPPPPSPPPPIYESVQSALDDFENELEDTTDDLSEEEAQERVRQAVERRRAEEARQAALKAQRLENERRMSKEYEKSSKEAEDFYKKWTSVSPGPCPGPATGRVQRRALPAS
ncbi:hypothetical protein CYMTET_36300 [Cymbomonas tetramitiformis]|uniref:Uncharacterized protein n=1 Tax=Cymbomonas tetramitiformis TaxID=36881 RepID=A0AAE0F7V4_9CHLO|nr:hypothetical protein CYMTET_36300 [Cymbomonas tetramitiformis]